MSFTLHLPEGGREVHARSLSESVSQTPSNEDNVNFGLETLSLLPSQKVQPAGERSKESQKHLLTQAQKARAVSQSGITKPKASTFRRSRQSKVPSNHVSFSSQDCSASLVYKNCQNSSLVSPLQDVPGITKVSIPLKGSLPLSNFGATNFTVNGQDYSPTDATVGLHGDLASNVLSSRLGRQGRSESATLRAVTFVRQLKANAASNVVQGSSSYSNTVQTTDPVVASLQAQQNATLTSAYNSLDTTQYVNRNLLDSESQSTGYTQQTTVPFNAFQGSQYSTLANGAQAQSNFTFTQPAPIQQGSSGIANGMPATTQMAQPSYYTGLDKVSQLNANNQYAQSSLMPISQTPFTNAYPAKATQQTGVSGYGNYMTYPNYQGLVPSSSFVNSGMTATAVQQCLPPATTQPQTNAGQVIPSNLPTTHNANKSISQAKGKSVTNIAPRAKGKSTGLLAKLMEFKHGGKVGKRPASSKQKVTEAQLQLIRNDTMSLLKANQKKRDQGQVSQLEYQQTLEKEQQSRLKLQKASDEEQEIELQLQKLELSETNLRKERLPPSPVSPYRAARASKSPQRQSPLSLNEEQTKGVRTQGSISMTPSNSSSDIKLRTQKAALPLSKDTPLRKSDSVKIVGAQKKSSSSKGKRAAKSPIEAQVECYGDFLSALSPNPMETITCSLPDTEEEFIPLFNPSLGVKFCDNDWLGLNWTWLSEPVPDPDLGLNTDTNELEEEDLDESCYDSLMNEMTTVNEMHPPLNEAQIVLGEI